MIMCLRMIPILFLAVSVLFPNGRTNILGTVPVYDEIVVAGDSYAQCFCNYERGKDLNIIEFSQEGTTIAENYDKLIQAFDSLHKLIFFSISVNDQLRGTHPTIFEENFRKVLDKSVETEKIVFVHTYMPYPAGAVRGLEYSTEVYDSVIRKLASEYPNVYYIYMGDCYGDEYITYDGIHYGKKFYDIMYDRLKEKINEAINK